MSDDEHPRASVQYDLVVRNAALPDGRSGMDIAVRDGRIAAVAPHGELGAVQGAIELDARRSARRRRRSSMRTSTWTRRCSYGLPRVNASGTLLEGIALWGELKPTLDARTRSSSARSPIATGRWRKGLLAIRSHVDVCDPRLLAVEALLRRARAASQPYLDLQLVAFPQDGAAAQRRARWPTSSARSTMGVDVVGGIPHFERTMADGARAVRILCEIAAERGLRVDMHCDETDDPHVAAHRDRSRVETQRLGLHGRVTGSHLTSMHSMDNYYVSKLIPLIARGAA